MVNSVPVEKKGKSVVKPVSVARTVSVEERVNMLVHVEVTADARNNKASSLD